MGGKTVRMLLAGVLVASLVVAIAGVAVARPDADGGGRGTKGWQVDKKPHPLGDKQAAEPHRVSWRLQPLRGLGHEHREAVFT